MCDVAYNKNFMPTRMPENWRIERGQGIERELRFHQWRGEKWGVRVSWV